MKVIGLDLEMEQPSGEILSVGISLLNTVEPLSTTENFYVKPTLPLSDFIKELTGLKESDFESCQSRHIDLKRVAMMLDELIENCGYSDELIVWGSGDVETLRKEFIENEIRVPFSRRYINVKPIYVFDRLISGLSSNKRTGLSTALNYHKMKFEGNAHNSADDALNTVKLYKKLLDKHKLRHELISKLGDTL